jgi:uroporphyrinogen decarboxylase
MLKVPLKKPEPDFDEFLKICEGLKDPDRVHHVEVIVDEEIKKEIMEKHLDQKFHPPVGMFFGEADKSLKSLKKEDHIKAKEDYYRMNISFHYHMGYSFVTDHDFLINLEGFNTVSEKTNDTAALSRGERFWAQEGQGLIRTWDDYEDFPWNKAGRLLEDYDSHLDFIGENLPDGMKIAVVGAVNAQLLGWMLGFEGLFYLIQDDYKLVKTVFDRMGEIISKMYQIAASKDKVGILWHGDDLGFKTSTMLSPDTLRELHFPWYRKYSKIAHSNGKKFWIHNCGFKDNIMEDLIEDIGMDALHSFEDTCCSIIEYKKKYGDRIALLGGVDIDKLASLEEEDLRKYVREILKVCMDGGRFALGSGNSITNFTPVENYLIMMDEGNKWFL